MRKYIIALVFAFAALATSQTPNKIEANKRPDNKLSYKITFDAPVRGDVSQLQMHFHIVTTERPDQRGLRADFWIGTFKKLSDVQYEVSDDSPVVKTGTYRLNVIHVSTGSANTDYSYPEDFKQDITVDIDTAEKDLFPGIKSVEESH